MGFRNGAYAKVWEVTPKSEAMTKVRLSISYKNKETDQYDVKFSSSVMFVGTACASKAAKLTENDRIQLLQVDVDSPKDESTGKRYYVFKCSDFAVANGQDQPYSTPAQQATSTPAQQVDSGELDDSRLPF